MIGIIILILIVVGWSIYDRGSDTASITTSYRGKAAIGESVEVPIFIDTKDQAVNAVEIYLKFNPAELSGVSLSKESSIFQLWIKDEPKFDNERGSISFAGGLPNPGFSGRGKIGSIMLQPKKRSRTALSFEAGTRALLNDGLGTAIPLDLSPIKIRVD